MFPPEEGALPDYTGHVIAEVSRDGLAELHYQPKPQDGPDSGGGGGGSGPLANFPRMRDRRDETGLFPPLPTKALPCRGRAPCPIEPSGFYEMSTKQGGERMEELPLDAGGYVSSAQFQQFAANFKGADGRYVAMTAYGAVPVPDDVMKEVPEKFVTQPKYEETETFVVKKKRHDRVTEKPFTQHEHHFVEVVKRGQVEKLVPAGEEKKIVIPRYFYKAIIAENIIEVPQGTRYAETPIDVHMRHPPKLVPVRKAILVQRNIECTKPVVQEKIIEKPKIIKRSIPKMVTKEIPFVVPKYVEKIIEVPFRPGMALPPQQGAMIADTELPECPEGIFEQKQEIQEATAPALAGMSFAGMPRAMSQAFQRAMSTQQKPKAPSPEEGNSPKEATANMMENGGVPGATIEGDALVLPGNMNPDMAQTVFLPPGVKEIKVPFEARVDLSVVQAEDVVPAMPHMDAGMFNFDPTMMDPAMMEQALADPAVAQAIVAQAQAAASMAQTPGAAPIVTPGLTAQQSLMVRAMSMQIQAQQMGAQQPGAQQSDSDKGWLCGRGEKNKIPQPPASKPRDPNAQYACSVEPVIMHDMPGMRNVKFYRQGQPAQVLTQHGMTNLGKIEGIAASQCCAVDVEELFPPFTGAKGPVPLSSGQLDMEELERIQEDFKGKMNNSFLERLAKEKEEQEAKEGAAKRKRRDQPEQITSDSSGANAPPRAPSKQGSKASQASASGAQKSPEQKPPEPSPDQQPPEPSPEQK